MVETPLSIYLIIPSSIFILIVGACIFFKRKTKGNLLFFLFSFAQFLWAWGTFIVWKGYAFGKINSSIPMNKLFALAIFLIPVFLYHITIEFCKVKNQKLYLFASYLISFYFVFAINVETVINGVFFYKWGDWSAISIIHYLFLIFVLLLLMMSLCNLFRAWHNRTNKDIRRDTVLYLLLGISIFGLIFIDFLPIYGINIYPLFYLTIPIYVLIMAYVFIEKNSLASIITTDVLAGILMILLSIFLIFPELQVTLIEKSVIFILICGLYFVALRYTHRLNEEKLLLEEKVREGDNKCEIKNYELNEVKSSLEETNTALEIKVRERTRALQGMNDSLEKVVNERTKEIKKKTAELEDKVKELEQFSSVFVDRENKMIELKEKIKELEDRLK